ncbi:hypothetical protein [Mesorhizobium sp. dw_380]|uniref:hypothetical protein n=1 Tax=Mesorhizobium sp. dw_380 TaxID=2812001 RepID=UPI001BDEA3BE|nr:hypothetical protein [Mesorhizobium sp. dw_380]
MTFKTVQPDNDATRKAVHTVLAIATGAGALLSTLAWHGRYWLWRDCFNELGRCYDAESGEVFLEQAGLLWGMFAVGCLLLSLVFARLASSRR